jgi:hypothetical protein
MASNEKPLIPVYTHAVGSQLVDVGHSEFATFSMPRGSFEYDIR